MCDNPTSDEQYGAHTFNVNCFLLDVRFWYSLFLERGSIGLKIILLVSAQKF